MQEETFDRIENWFSAGKKNKFCGLINPISSIGNYYSRNENVHEKTVFTIMSLNL